MAWFRRRRQRKTAASAPARRACSRSTSSPPGRRDPRRARLRGDAVVLRRRRARPRASRTAEQRRKIRDPGSCAPAARPGAQVLDLALREVRGPAAIPSRRVRLPDHAPVERAPEFVAARARAMLLGAARRARPASSSPSRRDVDVAADLPSGSVYVSGVARRMCLGASFIWDGLEPSSRPCALRRAAAARSSSASRSGTGGRCRTGSTTAASSPLATQTVDPLRRGRPAGRDADRVLAGRLGPLRVAALARRSRTGSPPIPTTRTRRGSVTSTSATATSYLAHGTRDLLGWAVFVGAEALGRAEQRRLREQRAEPLATPAVPPRAAGLQLELGEDRLGVRCPALGSRPLVARASA